MSATTTTTTTTTTDRRTHWREDVVVEIIEIPRLDDETKAILFYNKIDYHEFQEAEQRRYDKMMMKQIQAMVQQAMAPQIQQAIDRGATPEELEAMMPQTTEEIFALLGGIPAAAMPPPPKAMTSETIVPKSGPALAEAAVEIQEVLVTEPPLPDAFSDTIISEEISPDNLTDDDIYALLGVELDHGESSRENVSEQKQHPVEPLSTDGPSESDENTSPSKHDIDEFDLDRSAEAKNVIDDHDDNDKPGGSSRLDGGGGGIDHESDSSLNIDRDILVDTKTVNTNMSVPMNESTTSIHEELNEMFGTSMSSDVHLEDLIPKAGAAAPPDGDKTKAKYNLDEWLSSDDEDEPLVSENEIFQEAREDLTLETKLHASLPKNFLSGPRNTRSSITYSGQKHYSEEGYDEKQLELGSGESSVKYTEGKAAIGNHEGDPQNGDASKQSTGTQQVDQRTTSSTEALWGKAIAKETKKVPAAAPDATEDGPSELDPESHTPTSPKGRKKVPAKQTSHGSSPKIRHKVSTKAKDSAPNPKSSTEVQKRTRSRSVDVQGSGRPSDKDRRAGRKPSATMKRSNSDRELANCKNEEENHDVKIANGKRTGQKPAKSHSTHRKDTKTIEGHRKDYEVHGGWGNPLEFSASPKGSSSHTRERRKTPGKEVTNSS